MMRSKTEQALSLRIKEEAQRLGFELVGISPVKLPPHEESFAEWLRKELHGELEYMKRTEELRRDPRRLVPWAKSIVSVGMNYFTAFPRPAVNVGSGFKPATKSSCVCEATDEPKGWISRYAWGDDYHELMKKKLELLLETIRTFHDGPLEGKAF